MMPPVAVVIPIYVLFQTLGLLDTLPALIVTYTAANLAIVVLADARLLPVDPAGPGGVGERRRRLAVPDVPFHHPAHLSPGTGRDLDPRCWSSPGTSTCWRLFLSTANAQTMPVMVAAQNSTRGPEWWYMSVLILLMITPGHRAGDRPGALHRQWGAQGCREGVAVAPCHLSTSSIDLSGGRHE